MPRLMERDDVMRMAVNLGSAEEVWSEEYDTDSGDIGLHLPYGGSYRVVVLKMTRDPAAQVQRKGGLKIGLMKGKWVAPSEEDDRMMDEEIASSFDVDGGF